MSDISKDPELQKFLEQLREGVWDHPLTNQENRKLVPEGQRPCPICSQRMKPQLHSGIAVDVCDQHGLWLDKGEVAAIIEQMLLDQRRVQMLKQESAWDGLGWVEPLCWILTMANYGH